MTGLVVVILWGAVLYVVGFVVVSVVGFLGDVVVSFAGFLFDVRVVIGAVVGVVGYLLVVGFFAVVVEVGERRGAQVPAHLRAVPVLAPTTLRWVRGLLPSDEGTIWLAEVASLLAETTDKGERRRYVRSYRRNVPRLIWTSWTEYLRASRQRELL